MLCCWPHIKGMHLSDPEGGQIDGWVCAFPVLPAQHHRELTTQTLTESSWLLTANLQSPACALMPALSLHVFLLQMATACGTSTAHSRERAPNRSATATPALRCALPACMPACPPASSLSASCLPTCV